MPHRTLASPLPPGLGRLALRHQSRRQLDPRRTDHFFDFARWYFSSAGEPVSVYATANSKQPDHPELHDNFSPSWKSPAAATPVHLATLAAWEHHQTAKLTGTAGALWASGAARWIARSNRHSR